MEQGDRRLARSQLDVLADAWEAAWTGRDHASFTDCCTGDVQYEDPMARDPLMGVEALAAHAKRLWHALPDLRVERTGERIGPTASAAFRGACSGRTAATLRAFPPRAGS